MRRGCSKGRKKTDQVKEHVPRYPISQTVCKRTANRTNRLDGEAFMVVCRRSHLLHPVHGAVHRYQTPGRNEHQSAGHCLADFWDGSKLYDQNCPL